MARNNYLFTSESVSEGHPDKVCDRISDAVLDAFLAEEPEARVAAETFATTNRVVIGGEVGLSDQDKLHDYMGRIDAIARDCIRDIGYEQDKFHWETVEVTNLLHEQSAHIAQGVDAGWLSADTEWWVNPTGKFVIGGPDGDAGLTGRKIIVDTYGGAAPHGGGAFSGKDPTKVDRSAAYASRYLAKNVVASGLAHRCTIQLSYAIGVAKPLSIYCDTHGTGEVPDAAIEQAVSGLMDLTPRGIREHLGMNRPIYQRTAAYGHFGRAPEADGGFSWEKTDLVDALKKAV